MVMRKPCHDVLGIWCGAWTQTWTLPDHALSTIKWGRRIVIEKADYKYEHGGLASMMKSDMEFFETMRSIVFGMTENRRGRARDENPVVCKHSKSIE